MNGNDGFRISPRLIVGLTILAVGILWTLDSMDFMEAEPYTRFWPVALIVIGLSKVLEPQSSKSGGVALMVFGAFLLFATLTEFHFSFATLFPIGVALLGAKLVWDAMGRKRASTGSENPNSVVHAFALMSGIQHQNTSPTFRGGDANAIMGGVELDLRHAQMKDGEEAVIDAFTMWGGIEITVPENWRITAQVMPLLGGFENKTRPSGNGGPVLIIRGAAVMGAIEVKN